MLRGILGCLLMKPARPASLASAGIDKKLANRARKAAAMLR
jgi:hypothetical protein